MMQTKEDEIVVNGAPFDMSRRKVNEFLESKKNLINLFPLSYYFEPYDSTIGRIHVVVVVPEEQNTLEREQERERELEEIKNQIKEIKQERERQREEIKQERERQREEIKQERERQRENLELLERVLPSVLMNCATTISSREKSFKFQLCRFYQCKRRQQLRCMLLDNYFPSALVTAAHLFRRSNEYIAGLIMKIENIDDCRNGLLFLKPIELAFDKFQISFIYNETDDCFYYKLFDNNIRNTALIDFIKDENQKALLRKSKFDTTTTFGDLEEEKKTLKFKSVNRPYKRCLNLQARLALMKALKNNSIESSYDFKDFWSEGLSIEAKMEIFQQSIQNCGEV